MKTATMITTTILFGISAQAEKPGEKPDMMICARWSSDPNTYKARRMAAEMFDGIGVTVQFLLNPRTCPAEATQITLSEDTPKDLLPGALAYARPYEGVHIQIFYDRVCNAVRPRAVPYLLAHVLVHEITHILQGSSRHSATGIMKAQWDAADYSQMEQMPLRFASEDIRLIRQALSSRVAHPIAPRNAEVAKITAQ